MGEVEVGDEAPDLTLPDQNGREVTLSDLWLEKNVVLYFYPKDRSKGCTMQACAFRDSYEVFTDLGAEVVGVSSDGPESHRDFAEERNLPFILLSDQDGVARERYGVGRTFGVISGRVTFVIDRKGVVRHVFSSQFHPTKHIEESIAILKQIGD